MISKTPILESIRNRKKVIDKLKINKCNYQHPSSPEAHHTESAFKHEALKVSGGLLLLQSFGAVDAVRLFGLAFRVVHPLHVLP